MILLGDGDVVSPRTQCDRVNLMAIHFTYQWQIVRVGVRGVDFNGVATISANHRDLGLLTVLNDHVVQSVAVQANFMMLLRGMSAKETHRRANDLAEHGARSGQSSGPQVPFFDWPFLHAPASALSCDIYASSRWEKFFPSVFLVWTCTSA